MTVSENVGYRFIFGSLGLAPVLWKRLPTSLRWRAWCLLLVASVVGVPIQFLLQYKGLEATTVSHASLIVGTLPVLLALSSAVLLKEKLQVFEYGLMTLSAAGAVLIAMAKRTMAGPQPTIRGDLLVFLSMFAALVMILLSKRLMDNYGSLQVTAWMIGTGTLILLAWIEATHPMRFHFFAARLARGDRSRNSRHHSRIPVVELGLARVAAARAGVFLNLEPLVGTLLGVFVLGEPWYSRYSRRRVDPVSQRILVGRRPFDI